MALTEHMEKIVADFLEGVEIEVPDLALVNLSREKAEAVARGLNEVLTPEFDAIVKAAEKAGYDKGLHRADPAWWRHDLDAKEADMTEREREKQS